ncbi:MAG: hypothetical protein HZB53_08015 [Chloroflexi bacterium]|nr:hypothetical protein [Chloroflexota bacterium]
MTKLIYPVTVSVLFGAIIAELVAWRMPPLAAPLFASTFVLWLGSYLVPPRLFGYANDQLAPVVLTALMRRAGVAIACLAAVAFIALVATGLWLDLPFLEELYAVTLIGIVVFHGFGGPFAYHVVYLQETKQYNSNQLAAVLIAFTLMLFVLTLFFFNLDFGTARDGHTQLRDLLLFTTVFVGYGWTIYKVAHH